MMNRNQTDHHLLGSRFRYFYPVLPFLAIILPIILWKLDLNLIRSTYGKNYELFELFAFCVSFVLITVAGLEIKHKGKNPWVKLLPLLVIILVSFFFLNFFNECSQKSWDYRKYENAARAIIEGKNPFGAGYLYPPLTMQAFAFLHQILKLLNPLFHFEADPGGIWQIIF